MGFIEKVTRALEETHNITFGTEGVTAQDILKIINNSRLKPEKPEHTRFQFKDGGHVITDECPRCTANPALGLWDSLLKRRAPFCPRCGQAIDWSEYDGGKEEIDWDEYMKTTRDRVNRFLRFRKEFEDEL